MEMKAYRWAAYFCFAGILLFLLFPEPCAEGVREGIRLSGGVLIPSLFPVSVLSTLLVRLDPPERRNGAAKRVAGIFQLPEACTRLFLLGVLGGYPLGAQLTAELCADGKLRREDAVRFSAFCNHAGPAFLIGALGIGVFGNPLRGADLWIIQILSSLLVACVFSLRKAPSVQNFPISQNPPKPKAGLLPSAIASCAASMLRLAGSVCFFRALLRCAAAALPIGALPVSVLTAASGVLDLSGAVLRLPLLPQKTAFLTASFLTGFGGLCVHLQAASSFSAAGLPLKRYLSGKLLQGFFALCLAVPYCRFYETRVFAVGSVLAGALAVIFFSFRAKKHWKSSHSVL